MNSLSYVYCKTHQEITWVSISIWTICLCERNLQLIYPLSNAFSVNILVCSGRVLAWKNIFFFYYVPNRCLITIYLLHYEEMKKIFLVNLRISSVFILKHSNSRKNDYQSNEYNLGYSGNYVDFLIGLPIPRSWIWT